MSSQLFSEKLQKITSELKPNSHLLLVSKTRSADEIKTYYDLGQRDFGENRVQELAEKAQLLKDSCPEIRWHMIGNLQSNKINQLFAVPNLWAIHSVDSQELLEKLIKAESRLDHPVRVFIQYNTSREEEKAGLEDYESLKALAQIALKASKIKLQGVMTMGTLRTEEFEVEAKRCFRELDDLRERLNLDLSQKLETSMGMSQDYKMALEAKSNWIRLGTMMFKA